MPRKRAKKANAVDANTPRVSDSTLPKDDLLMLLPAEIISQVLIHTRSTRDVLAVARCSKYLCVMLVDPSNATIWSSTRRNTGQSLYRGMPDPPSGMTEPAYAAFVFDGGKCEICREYTKEKYCSFAIKLRLCNKKTCQNFLWKCQHLFWIPPLFLPNLDTDEGQNKDILRAVPLVESEWCLARERTRLNHHLSYDTWPSYKPHCRQKYWEQAKGKWRRILEVEGEEIYRSKLEIAIKKNEEWMEFCVALSHWKRDDVKERGRSKFANLLMSKMIANKNGYELSDLREHSSYGPMLNFERIASTVECELLMLAQQRERKRLEALSKNNLAALAVLYQHFRSVEPAMVLPPFPMFLRLPTIEGSLLNFDGQKIPRRRRERVAPPRNLRDLLKKPEIQIVIKAELSKWELNARQSFTDALGFPRWVSASATVLHPLDRLTARFRCKNCHTVSNHYKMDSCLDFVGVCRHECKTSDSKDENENENEKCESWDASRFERDQRATDAMRKLLTLLSIDEASIDSLKLFRKRRLDLGKRQPKMIVCMSCQPNLVLTDENVIGHCHRHGHDNMEMRLFRSSQPTGQPNGMQILLSETLVPGLVKDLIDCSAKGKKSQGEKKYGCRLCLYEVSHTFKRYMPDRLARMTFNGFKSHLKTKHGIEMPGDEDVFIFPSPKVVWW
ncbi:hypothetical protein F5887DRAFT_951858 [Amanita rubescens]|nr:hypothetical protein F5887DRAFT_967685 [Amanita rubescens]KAF8348777.1 hypothetical protein F5887DRAFT_951858 [Amanita rubescens]